MKSNTATNLLIEKLNQISSTLYAILDAVNDINVTNKNAQDKPPKERLATKKDIGKLCAFTDLHDVVMDEKYHDRIHLYNDSINRLIGIQDNGRYVSRDGRDWCYAVVLTDKEIKMYY